MSTLDVYAIVGQIEKQYAAAFCGRDAKALASLFTEDATALSEWGDVMLGRAEFERKLGRAFVNMPGDLHAEITPTFAAAVTDEVIVTHGRVLKSVGGELERLFYTRVLVRQADGTWKIAAVQVAPGSSHPDPRLLAYAGHPSETFLLNGCDG